MEIAKNLFRNTRSGILSKSIEAGTAFLTIPIIVKSLGQENYGLWIIIGQALVFFGALDFGITSSIGRFVAKFNGRNEKENVDKTISNAFLLLGIFAFLVLATIPIINTHLEYIFNIDAYQRQVASNLILVIGIGISIDFVLRIGRGLLSGFHRFDILYNTKIVGQIFKLSTILIFFLYIKSDNIILLGIIAMLAMIIPDLLMLIIAITKIFPQIRLKLRHISKSITNDLMSLGSANLLSGTIGAISKSITLILIGNLISLEAVTIYSIPVSMIVYPSMFLNTFLLSFTTMSSELYSTGKLKKLKKLNLLGIKYSFAINAGITLAVFYFGLSFLKIWIGHIFTNNNLNLIYLVLLILITSYSIEKLISPTARILSGIGKHWVVSILNIIMNVTAVIIGYILLKYTSLGIVGMAIGWVICVSIISLVIYPMISQRYTQIPVLELLRNILPVILYVISPIMIIYYFANSIEINSWFMLIIITLIYSTIYLALAFRFVLLDEHKNMLKEKLFIKN